METNEGQQRGWCPACDEEDVILTPGRLNPDQLICFNCGADVNAPTKVRPMNAVAVEVLWADMTPPLEDMTYDAREERVAGAAAADQSTRQLVSKRQRRRARQAELAKASAEGRVAK